MHPVLLDLHFAKIYSWGFMMAVAVILGIFGLSKRLKSEGYNSDLSFNIVISMIIAGIVGARIGYVLVYRLSDFLANPLYLFKLNDDGGFSGMMWYGGFILAVLTFYVMAKRSKVPLWKFADMAAPFFILGYAIVRIGCFLAGCCYGKVTTSALGVVFPFVDGNLRYPTQLFSSATNLIFFALLMFLYPKKKFHGQIFSLALMLYTVYRFGIEFFRDSEVYYGIFSPGQVISIPLFIIGLALYLYLAKQPELKKTLRAEEAKAYRSALRKAKREGRNALSTESCSAMNVKLQQNVEKFLKDHKAERIMTYFPIQNEANPLGKGLAESFMEKGALYLPRVESNDPPALAAVAGSPYEPKDDELSPWGIYEPQTEAVSPKTLDAILVPGLSFDAAGYRLGYGKGFYDRFLPLTKNTALRIGVGYDLQLAETTYPLEHDYKLDYIITDKRVIKCSSNK